MSVTGIYYFLKPAIPRSVRLTIRRLFARRLRRHVGNIWPIDPAAAFTPVGWPGWPGGKKFAFVLTHDVEGRKGLERCRALAEVEIGLGFRSSFNFVPEGEYAVSETLRAFLGESGFEVGIHDLHHDGSLYRSEGTFRRQAQRINQYLQSWKAVGFRSGFMFHNLEWLQDLNVLYDASTFDTDPFEPQPDGVRTIFPFWVPGIDGKGYVELPYTMPQDSTVFLLLEETNIDLWVRKLDWVAAHGGMVLLNTHPDYMSLNGQKRVGGYSLQLYRDLLEYVTKRYAEQCWFALPKEVAHYFYANMGSGSGVNKCLFAQEIAATSSPKGREVLLERPCNPLPVDRVETQSPGTSDLRGKRMAVVLFSDFPGDARPRRAAETFVQAGMHVDIICLMEEGDDPKQETFKGIHIDRVGIVHNRGFKFHYMLRYGLFIVIALAKLAARSLTKPYDIVHVHNMPDILVFAALVPKLFGAKVILDLHDPMPELMMTIFNLRRESLAVRLMARIEKWSIAFADVVVTTNSAFERLFVSRSCSASKMRIVMNSPDETIFKFSPAQMRSRPSDQRSAPFVIMYHGTLVDRNGADLAVEALVKLRQSVPAAELRLYGPRTPYLDQIMMTLSEKGLGKSVHYLGQKSLEQLTEAIAECDVGVIPNKRSIFTELNLPTRILEYLALGKPVVAPRTQGIQDYFREDSLMFFDLGNADDLALKLSHLYFHPEESFEVVKRGQNVYRAHVWDNERRKLVDVAVELLNAGHG
ncbi:MAG: glycosyltransferase [Nitrospira sp.]|nr:MAG: glycosyltransferase [Nitrospira sp.]